MIIEPADPFERGQLHCLHALPGTAPVNDFGLVQTIDRLGQRIVVAAAPTAYRRLDTGLGQALGVADRDIS